MHQDPHNSHSDRVHMAGPGPRLILPALSSTSARPLHQPRSPPRSQGSYYFDTFPLTLGDIPASDGEEIDWHRDGYNDWGSSDQESDGDSDIDNYDHHSSHDGSHLEDSQGHHHNDSTSSDDITTSDDEDRDPSTGSSSNTNWETSSTESRARVPLRETFRDALEHPYNYVGASSRLHVYRIEEMVQVFFPSITIPFLKELLLKWKLPRSGCKQELVQRVAKYVQDHYPQADVLRKGLKHEKKAKNDDANDTPKNNTGIITSGAIKIIKKAATTSSSNTDGLDNSSVDISRPNTNETITCNSSNSSPAVVTTTTPSTTKLIHNHHQHHNRCQRNSDAKNGQPNVNLLKIYQSILEDLNNVYARCRNGQRPFTLPPAPLDDMLVQRLKAFNFDYSLPYPWIIEEKLSLSLVTDLLPANRPFTVPCTRVPLSKPGERVLLVAIKFKTEDQATSSEPNTNVVDQPQPGSSSTTIVPEPSSNFLIKPFSTHPPHHYRHAYAREFGCFFNGRFFTPFYEVNKVHTISSYLYPRAMSASKPSTNLDEIDWMIHTIPSRYRRGYYFQIVTAHHDPSEWLRHSGRFTTRPAAQVFAQLKRDYGRKRHGISTKAIRISLNCPLSLCRMVTPIRTRKCRHPQCFDLTSWNIGRGNEGLSFNCPICDASIQPDAVFIDGLVLEMLNYRPLITEAIINPIEGRWRPAPGIKSEQIDEENRKKRARTLLGHEGDNLGVTMIDLTLTPDEPVDPNTLAIYIKPDPGAKLDNVKNVKHNKGEKSSMASQSSLPLSSPTPDPRMVVEIPSDPVILDESDVVYMMEVPSLQFRGIEPTTATATTTTSSTFSQIRGEERRISSSSATGNNTTLPVQRARPLPPGSTLSTAIVID